MKRLLALLRITPGTDPASALQAVVIGVLAILACSTIGLSFGLMVRLFRWASGF